MMVLCELIDGGAEVTALRLVRALGPRHQFTVAAIKPGGPLRDAFAQAGAAVFDGLAKVRFDPVGPFRVARLVRSRDIETVVIVDVPRNAMFHGLAGAALSCRRPAKVCWCKSIPGGQSGRFVPELRAYRKLGWLDWTVCTSQHQLRMLAQAGLSAERTSVIYNGVEPCPTGAHEARAPRVAGKTAIVHVANLMPDKDFDTLLAAARCLADSRDDFELLLVGRGTDGPGLAGRIAEAGLEGIVTPLGRRGDVREILAGAGLFVLSTHSEVCSVATLEAMSAGLAVVVSDIPAFEETFTQGCEGLKVRAGDAGAMAEALAGLLDDPAARARMGQAGRRRAEDFSLSRMAGEFDCLLRSLRKRR